MRGGVRWRWTARVADSGRSGALTVVWPVGLRAAYVSQPAVYVPMSASQPRTYVRQSAAYVHMSANQLARRAVHWLRRLGSTRCTVLLYSRTSGRTVL